MPTKLVLASSSPRRHELLTLLGISFDCRPTEVDETPLDDEDPETYVRRLAQAKAVAVASPGEIVLAADTIVVIDGEIFGKPSGEPDARRMLRALAGRQHQVLTGVAIHVPPKPPRVGVCKTAVTMAPMTDDEINWYAATGEPADKAGAYAIQGLGSLFVDRVDGNYSNVVGLPLPTVYGLFREGQLDLLEHCRTPDLPLNDRT